MGAEDAGGGGAPSRGPWGLEDLAPPPPCTAAPPPPCPANCPVWPPLGVWGPSLLVSLCWFPDSPLFTDSKFKKIIYEIIYLFFIPFNLI